MKRKKTKVHICYEVKIEDLAEEIYSLEIPEILCLFKEVDARYASLGSDSFCNAEWNKSLQKWIETRFHNHIKSS